MNLRWSWSPPSRARRMLAAAAGLLCAGMLTGAGASAAVVRSTGAGSHSAVRSYPAFLARAVRPGRGTVAVHRAGTVSLAVLARADTRDDAVATGRPKPERLRAAPLRLPPGAVGVTGIGVTGGTVTARWAGNVRGAHGFNGLTSAISGALNSRPASGIGYVSPPDPTLAVGQSPKGTAILEFVNDALSIYTPSGRTLLGPVPAYKVFGLPASALLSDPRAFYDFAYGYWYLTASVVGNGVTSPLSAQYLAVSQTSNPFGRYAIFSLNTSDAADTAGGCPCFGDFAQLGIGVVNLYISESQFSVDHAKFDGSVIYSIPLGSPIAPARGLPGPVAQVYVLPSSADPFGAFDLSPSQYAPGFLPIPEFFVESDSDAAGGSGLEIYGLVNYSPAQQTLVEVSVPTEAYALPPPAVQRRGPAPYGCRVGSCATAMLDTDFDAVQQVTYARGVLYAELDTGVRIGKARRSGIAWFAISVALHSKTFSASLIGQGYLESSQYLLDPVIAVNGSVSGAGEGYMAFAVASSTRYPSAAYVAFDGVHGPVGPIRISAQGTDPLDDFTCYPKYSDRVCRFGDYSAAEFWDRRVYMVTEYVGRAPRDTYSNWDTRIWYAPDP
jgi:hypothetical protein